MFFLIETIQITVSVVLLFDVIIIQDEK